MGNRRLHGFSEASYYLWRSKFDGMNVSDAKRLRELEAENARLKKPLAESMLENEVIKDALRKSGDRASATRAGAADDRARAEPAAGAVSGEHQHLIKTATLADRRSFIWGG